MFKELLNSSWLNHLALVIDSDKIKYLEQNVAKAYDQTLVFPPKEQLFNALNLTSLTATKVVIIGQDPYHNLNQANGLSFSVADGIKTPPSLKNIYKEIESDLAIKINKNNGNLTPWAKQGVLLLNAILSVEAHQAASHQKIGWEYFTNQIIEIISKEKEHVVFLLWGKFAQQKASLIDQNKHLILTAAHPSPFSAHRGFFGCKHFSKTNNYLTQHQLKPINWTI